MNNKDKNMNTLLLNMLGRVMKSNIDKNIYGGIASASLEALNSIDLTLKNMQANMSKMSMAGPTYNLAHSPAATAAIAETQAPENAGNDLTSAMKTLIGEVAGSAKASFLAAKESQNKEDESKKKTGKKKKSTSKKSTSKKSSKSTEKFGDKMLDKAVQVIIDMKSVKKSIESVGAMKIQIQDKLTFKMIQIKNTVDLFRKQTEGQPLKVKAQAFTKEALEKLNQMKAYVMKSAFVLNVKTQIKGAKDKLIESIKKPYVAVMQVKDQVTDKIKKARKEFNDLQKKAKNEPLETQVKIYGKAALKKIRKAKKNFSKMPMVVNMKANISGIKSSMKGVAGLLKNAIPFAGFASILSKAGGIAVDYLSGKLKKGFSEAWSGNENAKKMQGEINKVKDAFGRIDGVFQKVMTGLFNSVFNAGGDGGNAVLGGIVSMFENVAAFLEENEPIISSIIDSLVVGFVNGFTGLMTFLQPVFGFIGSLFESFGIWMVTLKDTISEMMPAVQEKLAVVMDWLAPKIEFISEVFSFLFDKWIESWPIILDVLKTVWKNIEPVFVEFGKIVDDVFVIFGKVFDYVKENWPKFQTMLETGGDIVASVFETIADVLGSVYDFLGWIISRFTDLLGIDENGASGNMTGKLDGELESRKSSGDKEALLAVGMEYVPYDNFPALLHQGERVLTANENDQLRRGGLGAQGVVINIPKLAENINASSPADVDHFLGLLEDKIVGIAMNMG